MRFPVEISIGGLCDVKKYNKKNSQKIVVVYFWPGVFLPDFIRISKYVTQQHLDNTRQNNEKAKKQQLELTTHCYTTEAVDHQSSIVSVSIS